MTTPRGDLLIVAQSARMLAQSACRGGWSPLVVDLFGDTDTRAFARKSALLDSLTLPAVATACKSLAAEPIPLVYGSGLDNHPEWVAALQRDYDLYGNTPETLAAIRNPEHFFSRLEALDIPFPETRFSPPCPPGDWLVKSACGEGGMRVAFVANFHGDPSGRDYFQRFAPGLSCSLLFVANGKTMRPTGFNTQLTIPLANQPFLFSGAINDAPLDVSERLAATNIAATLTREFGLVGVNSLDFVAGATGILVLEVNPRPSATAQIHDHRFPNGWLDAHIRACQGELTETSPMTHEISGFRIVYAATDTFIDDRMVWPDFCADLPSPGSKIPAGRPVCTVLATGPDRDSVLLALSERVFAICQRLGLTADAPLFVVH